MQNRTATVFLGCGLAAALTTAPAHARVGVDEGSGGSGSRSHAATAASDGPGTAGYDEKEGGYHFRSSSGDYKLVVGGRLQMRFDGIRWDSAVKLDNINTFNVRRARLILYGNFMGQQNTFFLQIASDGPDVFLSQATGSRNFLVADAWLKHQFCDAFAIKGGQFKVPLSRQNLTSGARLQFPDRALAVRDQYRLFGFRDVGLEVSGGMSDNRLQYALAVVNGEGTNTLNVDNHMGVYGRVSVSPTGDYGYAEGDIDETGDIASTLGAAVHYQRSDNTLTDGTVKITRVDFDGGIKYRGLSLQGEFFVLHIDPTGGIDRTDKSYYAQAGYFVQPKRLEVAVRTSRLLNKGADNDVSEYSAGLNLFCMGHRLKWQAAYSYFNVQGKPSNLHHHQFTGGAQIWF